MPSLKEQLYLHCKSYVQQRINTARQGIDEARISQANETKSSAGDKYETARAMAQQEIDRNEALLAEAQQLLNTLNKLNTTLVPEVVMPGSIVLTDKANFYIAISAGAITVNDEKYFAISAGSPIGLKLAGKKVKEEFEMNRVTYLVKAIL